MLKGVGWYRESERERERGTGGRQQWRLCCGQYGRNRSVCGGGVGVDEVVVVIARGSTGGRATGRRRHCNQAATDTTNSLNNVENG